MLLTILKSCRIHRGEFKDFFLFFFIFTSSDKKKTSSVKKENNELIKVKEKRKTKKKKEDGLSWKGFKKRKKERPKEKDCICMLPVFTVNENHIIELGI